MKLFQCPNCGHRLYFENSLCLSCGNRVLYSPPLKNFVLAEGRFRCANAGEAACNWEAEENDKFCLACRLNKTIPDLSIAGNRERWARVEEAKRRVIYSLLSYGLAVEPKDQPSEDAGIAFDFLADDDGDNAGPGGERILTGHDNGLITLNVAEADSPEREKMRIAMGEDYRTLIGHFRHELGHYYWDRLIRDDADWLTRFRDLFGDDSADYETALSRHYASGAPAGWRDNHITPYAASHPWEDWAETWAHYLHIADALEMAEAYRVPLDRIDAAIDWAPQSGSRQFDPMIARWLALAESTNSLNRCMGLPDFYPFVIADKVAEKLRFVGELLEGKGMIPVGAK